MQGPDRIHNKDFDRCYSKVTESPGVSAMFGGSTSGTTKEKHMSDIACAQRVGSMEHMKTVNKDRSSPAKQQRQAEMEPVSPPKYDSKTQYELAAYRAEEKKKR